MRRVVLAVLLGLLGLLACGGAGSSSSPAGSEPAPADGGLTDAAPSTSGDATPDASIDDRDRLEALVDALAKTAAAADRTALFAKFVHDVAYGPSGFPIHARGAVTFVYWDEADAGGPLAVAGDFDAWSTTSVPMQHVAASLWTATVQDPAPAARSLYKFVRGGSQFFADPLARSFGFDANGEHSLLAAGTTDGRLERWPAFCDSCGSLAARPIYAWLPPGYDASTAYPLLVMHDGQNLFDPSGPNGSWHVDTTANDGVKSGALRPFIVIAIPSSAARFDEYTHTTDTLPGVGTVGGNADAYASFVASGVVPFARSRYHLRSAPADNAILGSSLGGLVSLYIARSHPEIFGAAGSMSGTMSWGSIGQSNPTIEDLYVQKPPSPGGLSLYLDSGGDDGGNCATLSALDSETFHDQYCETRAMRDALVGLGWTLGTNLTYAWAPNATHGEAAWAARLPNALATWFPRR